MTYFFGINFDKKTSPQAKKTYKSTKKTKALSGVKEDRKKRLYEEITKHGENLNKIFGLNEDPIRLSKRLFSMESKASRVATDWANGDITEEKYDKLSNEILSKIKKILKLKDNTIPIFINGDPRGYALKIKSKYVRDNNLKIYTDMGGYGILAPDFNYMSSFGGVKEATKPSTKKTKNSKKTPQAEGMQLGAMLIKQGLVTSMPMPKLAKMISRWNATGRQNKLEEFIKNELPNITSTQASKKSKVSKKKITKKKVKVQKKKNTRREKIKKDDYIPF